MAVVTLMTANIVFYTVHLRAALPKGVQPITFYWAKSCHSFWKTKFCSIFQVSPASKSKGMSTAIKPRSERITLTDDAKQPGGNKFAFQPTGSQGWRVQLRPSSYDI